jgi:hypothetical protein
MSLKQVWESVVNYFDLQRDNRDKSAVPKETASAAPQEPVSLGKKILNYFDLRIR